MNPHNFQAAWVAEAQRDAERGVLLCRMCKSRGPIEEAISLWQNGLLLFALCARCTGAHDLLLRRVARGLEVRAIHRGPLLVGAS